MRRLFRLVKLMAIIARKGKMRHTGVDYSRLREHSLQELVEFCPREFVRTRGPATKTAADQNPAIRAMKGEFAFLLNSVASRGGHITAPLLKLSYIRIPKAASTAFSSAILHARFPALERHTLSPEKINFLADANLQTQMPPAEKKGIFFTVVRNPFARIVSVYRAFFENKGEDFLYEDYLFGIFRHTVSFREFVDTVQLIPDLLKDQHLRPQHLFLQYYHRKKIRVRVFALEEPASWSDFLRRYTMEIPMVDTSDPPYDYRTYFDSTSLQIVFDLYQVDIFRFGYEPAYRDLKRWVHNVSV